MPVTRGAHDFTGAEAELGIVSDAAFIVDCSAVPAVIAWLGPAHTLPDHDARVDLGGRVVLPGLVDPHTHLVFAGDRAADFNARCSGVSYETIAARGGGIRTTVRATRAASETDLIALARPRLAALARSGVTTIEIKSGYGLDAASELQQLRAIRALADSISVYSTLLFHLMPEPYLDDRAAGIAASLTLLDAALAEDLVDYVDVFCEEGAFTPDEAALLLREARARGVPVKAHVDQRTATGFAAVAADLGALSLDHLEHLDPQGIAAMAAHGTIATLLPAASLFLGDPVRPPVAALRAAGVPFALATDFNPGTSPTWDPWLVATLACTWYGLTPVEALRGLTCEAAAALGLRDGTGQLRVGSPADFVVAHATRWEHLLYGLGHHPIAETWRSGVRVATGLSEVPPT